MELKDFPRPPADNGRGIHWSASIYHPEGEALRYWINELKEMNIKWVKLLDDGAGSSLKLCEALLNEGIMPVVRLYRHEPNPGHIGGREVETVKKLVSIGVRYLETNNEPNIPIEWKGGYMPPNWVEIVVENFIIDADIILGLGGLPAIPAFSVGEKTDIFSEIARRRPDLFEAGIWAAIHNYTLNHPIDYPYDPVNQEGKPLTREEYLSYGPVEWVWDRNPLEWINEWRAKDKNPGATVMEDPSCFLAFEQVNALIVRACGHSIPIISTEGGPSVGSRDDRRYPRITPALHRDIVVAINDFMQRQAPPYYFAMCHWLIANYKIGHFDPTWETQAWYTDWWNDLFGLSGRLPAVDAVKAMPSLVRVGLGTGAIAGILRDKEGRNLVAIPVALYQKGARIGLTYTDITGLFRFSSVPPGEYDIVVEKVGAIALGVELAEGENKILDLEPLEVGIRGAIAGKVMDERGKPQPGVEVILLKEGKPLAKTRSSALGEYSFQNLGEGIYGLKAGPLVLYSVALDGWKEEKMDITLPAPPGYRYKVITKRLLPPEETMNRRLFYGQVLDENGIPISGIKVMMSWTGAPPGTPFPIRITGQVVGKPPGYYEFLHTPGEYQLMVVQGDWESEVADGLNTASVPGREPGAPVTYEVNFQLLPVGQPQGAIIRGELSGIPQGHRVILRAPGFSRVAELESKSRFAFYGLSPGEYSLELEGLGTIASGLKVTDSEVFFLLMPFQSTIQGRVSGLEEGTSLRLVSEEFGWEVETKAGPGGAFRFENLPRGRYHILIGEKELAEAEVDGLSIFTLPDLFLEGPFSFIGGKVLDDLGRAVGKLKLTLLKEGVKVAETTTSADGSYRFSYIKAGIYEIRAEGFGVVKSNLIVDGQSPYQVDITLPAIKPRKPLSRCLYFGSLPLKGVARVNFLVSLQYIVATGTPVVFSLKEASQAQEVIIVGDERLIGPEEEQALKETGCEVRRISGDSYAIARTLGL
ncbi:MAG: carboxypeptidase-like regulatory domain-containing protein [Anaerolineae bacterium]|nr:carboxypeptidase-like regulatory domain-containing protein [Anaerolineae bacterium]